jgi:hypothetical protein
VPRSTGCGAGWTSSTRGTPATVRGRRHECCLAGGEVASNRRPPSASYDPSGLLLLPFFGATATWKEGRTRRGRQRSGSNGWHQREGQPDAMHADVSQFHQQSQPRKIIQTPQQIRIDTRRITACVRFIWTAASSCRRASRSRGGMATPSATGKAIRSSSRRITCAARKTAPMTKVDVNGSPYSQQAKSPSASGACQTASCRSIPRSRT